MFRRRSRHLRQRLARWKRIPLLQIMNSDQTSFRKIPLQRFSTGEVLQKPAIIFQPLPGPTFGWRFAGENARKLKPDETFRGLAWPGVTFVLGRHFDLPAIGSGAGDDEWKGSFCELDERGAIKPGGDQDLAGHFGSAAFRCPNRLAFAHGPSGLVKVRGRETRDGGATRT
jgi:hypothetical protein